MTKIVYLHAFHTDEDGNQTYTDEFSELSITGWCVYMAQENEDGQLDPTYDYPEWDFNRWQDAWDFAVTTAYENGNAVIREY